MRLIALAIACVWASAIVWADDADTTTATNAHSFDFQAIEGGDLPMAGYDGDVVLVVNTASYCGFTGQYRGLQNVWEQYQDQGFVVLGVPSDDFGQEKDSDAEVAEFCEVEFGINFPMTSRTTTRVTRFNRQDDPQPHPFYEWARGEIGTDNFPRWNFNKILIARDGTLAGSFGQGVGPESDELKTAIEAALASGGLTGNGQFTRLDDAGVETMLKRRAQGLARLHRALRRSPRRGKVRPSVSYVLAGLVVAAMLGAAIKPGLDRRANFSVLVERAKIQGLVIRGEDLGRFMQTGGTSTGLLDDNNLKLARMNATRPAHRGMPTPGVVYLLPAQLTEIFSDGGVKVTVRSRGAPLANQSSGFRAAFTLEENGRSSMSPTFEVDRSFRDHAFVIESFGDAPHTPAHFRIWPDVEGGGGFLDIEEVRFDHMSPLLRGAD